MTDEYKSHEDNFQHDYLEEIEEARFTMSSCLHLARRFVHSENRYMYRCESHEPDGCPKRMLKGIANLDCLKEEGR